METFYEFAKFILVFLLAGMLIALGVRAIEWIVPAPESRLMICMADELGTHAVCKEMHDFLDRRTQGQADAAR